MGIALVGVVGLGACDPGDDGEAAESAAGSESSGGDTGVDAECRPEGLAEPGADVVPEGSISSWIGLLTPGSDPAGGGASVRFGLFAGEGDLPPREELAGFVNGCPIPEEPPEGEGQGAVFFHASDDEVPVELVGGGRLTIEVRHGDDVLMRRTAQLPATLPELTSPAAGAALDVPITLGWAPLGLDSLAADSTELGATAWIFEASGSASTDGSLELVDADGTATWTAGDAEWTHLQLQAYLDYGAGFVLSLSHFQPVNRE